VTAPPFVVIEPDIVEDGAGMEMAYRERWEAEIAEMRRVLAGLAMKEECKWGKDEASVGSSKAAAEHVVESVQIPAPVLSVEHLPVDLVVEPFQVVEVATVDLEDALGCGFRPIVNARIG